MIRKTFLIRDVAALLILYSLIVPLNLTIELAALLIRIQRRACVKILILSDIALIKLLVSCSLSSFVCRVLATHIIAMEHTRASLGLRTVKQLLEKVSNNKGEN